MGDLLASTKSLQVKRGYPNPNGAEDTELYLLEGDATAGDGQIEISSDYDLLSPRWRYNKRPFRLKLLHFNDLHGHISRIRRASGNVPIFSKIVSYIRQNRAACAGNDYRAVLVFSGGDDIIGSPFDTLVGNCPENYDVHAGYDLYSKAGVDAGVLGNHEFDLGAKLLCHAIRTDAGFPLLSANLKPTAQLKGCYSPAAIFVVKGVRIGVIGLTTPFDMWSRGDTEVEIVDPLAVVKRILPGVRAMSDVVVIVSHLGRKLGAETAPVRMAGDVELAESLPFGAVELIIGAHTHDALNEGGLELNNVVNGIPIVQAGYGGRYLGEVDIVIRDRPTVADVHLNFTAEMPVDEEFETKYVFSLFKKIRPIFERKLGRVEDTWEITGDACCDDCAFNESALHNFITDTMVSGCRAAGYEVDFAVLDSSALRAGLTPGSVLTYADWLQVLPYADTLVICEMTGAQVRDFIDDNARRVDISGEPHEERGFLQFSKEIRYRIKIAGERSQIRAQDITIGGVPIEEQLDRTFIFVCTSFFRGLAHIWEEQAMASMDLFRYSPKDEACFDSELFLRDVTLARIEKFQGVTRESGAIKDGRLIVF